MSGISRRDILRTLAAGAVSGSVLQVIPAEAAELAHQMVMTDKAASPAGKYVPKYFSPHQYETLTIALRRHHSQGRSFRRRCRSRCAGVY